jgi:actin-like ATPase involved in cell morphogenesis
MTEKLHIGIDFGTSNSAVCWWNPRTNAPEVIRNEHGEEKTPSVVYRGVDGTLVGKPALDQLADVAHMDEEERLDVLGRTFMSVKRLLKDNLPLALPDGEMVTPVELASDILYALKQSAEHGCFNGELVTTATITHPVTFGKKQIANLKEAAGLAGFDEVRLMEEPVAAIHGYAASGAKTGDGILVFDFGGGTLDLAFLRKEDDGEWHMPVPPIGEELGGDDFDRLIYDHFERELKQKHGAAFGLNGSHNLAVLNLCRLAKEKLSSQAKSRLSYLMPESNLSMRFELDRSGLESLIENDVLKAGQLAQRMIERVSASGHCVESVILIGGATRMPAIQETLKSGLPVKPMATMHADVAVAMGASQQCQSQSAASLHGSIPISNDLPRVSIEPIQVSDDFVKYLAQLLPNVSEPEIREDLAAVARAIAQLTATSYASVSICGVGNFFRYSPSTALIHVYQVNTPYTSEHLHNALQEMGLSAQRRVRVLSHMASLAIYCMKSNRAVHIEEMGWFKYSKEFGRLFLSSSEKTPIDAVALGQYNALKVEASKGQKKTRLSRNLEKPTIDKDQSIAEPASTIEWGAIVLWLLFGCMFTIVATVFDGAENLYMGAIFCFGVALLMYAWDDIRSRR